MKESIETGAAPAAIGPYSQAIRAGDFIFISGQLGLDPGSRKFVEGGVETQTRRAIENIAAILSAAGSGLEAIVKTTVYLHSMDDFPEMNEVYSSFFGSAAPARATVEVAKLPLGALVEIEAVAYLGP